MTKSWRIAADVGAHRGMCSAPAAGETFLAAPRAMAHRRRARRTWATAGTQIDPAYRDYRDSEVRFETTRLVAPHPLACEPAQPMSGSLAAPRACSKAICRHLRRPRPTARSRAGTDRHAACGMLERGLRLSSHQRRRTHDRPRQCRVDLACGARRRHRRDRAGAADHPLHARYGIHAGQRRAQG